MFDYETEIKQYTPSVFYKKYGFIVLRDVIPQANIDRLDTTLASEVVPYKGTLPRHVGGFHKNQFSEEGLLINALEHPHVINKPELAGFTRAMCDIVFHPRLGDRLREIDGEAVHVLAQTLLFFISPRSVPHIDSFSLDTWPEPGYSYTCWIALEDIQPDAGPPLVYPGQQDVLRMQFAPSDEIWKHPNPAGAANIVYTNAIGPLLKERNAQTYTPQLKRGDVLVWGPRTPHASNPPLRENASRKSIQALYWPASMGLGSYVGKSGERKILDYNAQFKFGEINYPEDPEPEKAPFKKLRTFFDRIRQYA